MKDELRSSENFRRITLEIPKACKCLSITYVTENEDSYQVKNRLIGSLDIENLENGTITTL